MSFSDTTSGKIFIGSVLALISFLVGAGGTWVLTKNEPPKMVITPNDLTEEILRKVRFNAGSSEDPEGTELSFDWQLNGLSINESQVGQCIPVGDGEVLECQFVSPGTHAVSVTGTDRDGKYSRVTSSVTVTFPGGYVALFINGSDQSNQLLLERVLLIAVDWLSVQAKVEKPIILNDPDKSSVVYATSQIKDAEKASHLLRVEGLGDGALRIDIVIGPVPRDALSIIKADMANVGVEVNFNSVDYSMSTASRQGDGFIGLVDKPGSLESLVEQRNAAE